MRYILTLLIGAVLGGVLAFYFLVGAPRARQLPGSPIQAPDQNGSPPGTAILTLDENFFNTLLGTIFRDLQSPTFQLSQLDQNAPGDFVRFTPAAFQGGGCTNAVVLTPEGSNVKTSVRFTEGKIMAPLAFSGSYNAFGNCLNFKGWAQANIQLRFDQEKQTLYGQINVEGVNLDNVSPIFSPIVTGIVQSAINSKVNPLEVMSAAKLTLAVPVQASGGTLKAQVKDVRAEVPDGALRLHITYDFNAIRN